MVNSNTVKLSDFKGEVTLCPHCANIEQKMSGTACRFCLANGYLAVCLNCNGTGMVTGTACWDGKSKHTSVCNPCSGLGTFPARASEYRPKFVMPEPQPYIPPSTITSTPLIIHRTGSKPVAAADQGE